MPTDAGAIALRFHVLLVPIGPDGVEQHDHPVDGGIVEVALHIGTGRPGPVMRDAGLDRYVGGIIQRDTQANETGRGIGQATDPGFVPGVGTPADVERRIGVTFEGGLRPDGRGHVFEQLDERTGYQVGSAQDRARGEVAI